MKSLDITKVTPEQMAAALKEIAESDNPEELAELWLAGKAIEDAASELRTHISKKLAELLPVPEDKGQKTHTAGAWKVTVKPRVNTSVDWDAFFSGYKAYCATTPEDARVPAPFDYVPKLEEKGLHWIRENATDLFAHIAPSITTKPGAVGIEIKPAKKEVVSE